MTKATIGYDGWDSVVTTTADTVFQNRSSNIISITTESTGSLSFDDGFQLDRDESIVISSGKSVSAVSFGADGTIFYMEI